MTTITPSTRVHAATGDREQFIQAIPGDHGVCTRHRDIPLMKGTFTWGHHAHSMFGGGLETFPSYRHADGTPCVDMYGGKLEPDEWVRPYHVPTCRKCKASGDDIYECLQEAYGDRITCRECGDSRWYSIGD